MKPIELDAFKRFKFISGPAYSPNGKNLCFVLSEVDEKKNDYLHYIYARKGGRFIKLTSGGKERSFQFLDDSTLLFPGDREGDKDYSGSRFYKLSLNGGEAELFLSLPLQVSCLLPLRNGDFVLTASTVPGFEELYKGDKKLTAAYKKHVEDNKDYEEIEQSPWWWNGASYTKGSYESLFYYESKKKRFTRLSDINENAFDISLSKDEKRIYFCSTPVEPALKMSGAMQLFSIALDGSDRRCLCDSSGDFELCGYKLADSFILIIGNDRRYGLNTDSNYYKLPLEGGELSLYAKHGFSMESSILSDIRMEEASGITMDGDKAYFVSTRFDDAHLFCLENGEIKQLTNVKGSVDSFAVKGDKLVLCSLWGMKGQELYDPSGKQLTHFNDRVLKNYYVAEPEQLNCVNGDHEVHGFVLKPIDYEPGKKYPVILDVHGGPKCAFGSVFYHEMAYWTGLGYFVIYCNPTGSDGRGEFMDILGKYGTVDYEDIMTFCDRALEAYPDMDAANFFETGGSYGGFMTNWIIGHTDRFRACASQRSISNWFSFYGVSDIGPAFTLDQNLSTPWQDPGKLWQHSPLKYADRVKTPTLFIHSFEDYRCPIDQGYQMFTALLQHGVESKLVAFRGENHELSRTGKPSHRIKRLNEITQWFEKHKG